MKIVIPDTDISTSRLGFGTGSLHHLFTSSSRQRLLSIAYDEGIRHFDCARLYGHGVAEREIGAFARNRRQDLVICSKVGLVANPIMEKSELLMYAAKALGKISVGRELLPSTPRYIPLNGSKIAAAAEASLARSLAALRSDYLDVLFLHEPPVAMIEVPEALIKWFRDVKARGLARYVGIAGSAQVVARMAPASPELADVLQVSDSLQSRDADHVKALGRDLQITYGYFRKTTAAPLVPENSSPLPIKLIVAQASLRNPRGVILFSSNDEAHIRELCGCFRSGSAVRS